MRVDFSIYVAEYHLVSLFLFQGAAKRSSFIFLPY